MENKLNKYIINICVISAFNFNFLCLLDEVITFDKQTYISNINQWKAATIPFQNAFLPWLTCCCTLSVCVVNAGALFLGVSRRRRLVCIYPTVVKAKMASCYLCILYIVVEPKKLFQKRTPHRSSLNTIFGGH